MAAFAVSGISVAVVFRMAHGQRVERIDIEVGIVKDGIVEVVAGLSPGDRVVERGHSRLVDGELVAPRTHIGEDVEELAAPRTHIGEDLEELGDLAETRGSDA